MKENTIKALTATAIAALGTYFQIIFIPLIILFAAVIIDYFTGLTKAWMKSELSSKKGFIGIIKKLSYFVVVAVGMGADTSMPTLQACAYQSVIMSGTAQNSVSWAGIKLFCKDCS